MLVEATPILDTYEGRQRARILIGLALIAILLVGGLALFQALAPDEEAGDLAPRVADTGGGPDRQAIEREALVALADARGYALRGEMELTLRKLDSILAAYPGTAASERAREALERGRQGLPLFDDAPLVIAEPAEAPRDPAIAPPPAVDADASGAAIPDGPPTVAPAPPAGPSPAPAGSVVPSHFPPGSMPF